MTESQQRLFSKTWDALAQIAKDSPSENFYDFIRVILAVGFDFSKQVAKLTGDNSVEFADTFWQELLWTLESDKGTVTTYNATLPT